MGRTAGTSSFSPALSMVFDVPSLEAEHPSEQSSTKDEAYSSTGAIIDGILDECLRYSARRPIMRQFDPASTQIWRQWRGTVFSETRKSAAMNAMWAMGVYALFKKYPACSDFLTGFDKVWAELLAVTTFTLTFFVNESYSCWRNCLNICYGLQAGLNNFAMAVAGCAKRAEPRKGSSAAEESSKFTPTARKTLLIIARYLRLFNILSYASFTRSHRPLLTPQGMRRMVKRGLITEKERSILMSSRIYVTNRHNMVLMWMLRTALDGRRAGHFEGGFGFEQNILLRVQEIRGEGNYLSSILRGRMPFGYAHIVQVLVDLVCWLYPIMAYSSGTTFQIGVLGIVFLTVTYQGLFDLSKRFLDPFHNENFWSGDDPIRVDTLIAETNAGSRRWMFGLDDMPIPMDAIQNGGRDLDLFVLPDEGYTVEDVAQMEALEEEEKLKETDESLLFAIGKEDKLEDEQQAFQEEFVETQAIMSAPPGADFVPGIDDVEESDEEEDECTMFPDDEPDLPLCEPDREYDDMDEGQLEFEDLLPPNKVYETYMEVAAEEYEEALRRGE